MSRTGSPSRVGSLARSLRAGALTVFWAAVLVVPAGAQSVAYLPTFTGNSVVVYDVDSNSIVTTLNGVDQPLGVAVSPDGSQVYITEYNGAADVHVIDTASNTVTGSIPVGGYAWTVTFSKDGAKAYVSNADGVTPLTIIDTASRTVAGSIPLPYSVGSVLSPDGSKLYVASHAGEFVGISVIDTGTDTVSTSFPIAGCIYDVEVNQDGTRLFAMNACQASVEVLDAATGSTLASIPADGWAYNLALSPDGSKLYAAMFTSSSVLVIDTATLAVSGNVTVPTAQPAGIAFTPDGSKLLITHPSGTGETALIDAASHAVTVGASVGGVPYAMGNPFASRPADSTPPVITSSVSGTLGGDGWYTSDVTVAWNVTDEESAFTESGCGAQTVTSDTSGTTFTCAATSAGGPSAASVTIKRDTSAPAVVSATANPSVLWPANNKMAAVTVSVDASDAGSGAVTCSIDSIGSNEGGSAHEPDVQLTGDLTMNLRAERAGKGSGRIYTAHISCTDAAGNTSSSTATVTVPHDQRKK